MALGTLAEIRTAALGLRTDLEPRFLPEIMPLAEQRIFYGDGALAPLRVLPMEASASVAFTAGTASLPDDFLDKRALYWSGSGGQIVALGYEPPSVFYPATYGRTGGAWPAAYTVEGLAVKISPALSGNATLLYYQRPGALEADADTNVILARWPGVYLYSLQMEVHRITRDDQEFAKARQWYVDAVTAANRQTVVARTLGGPLNKRTGFAV